jgi:hypothetical protein
MATSRLPPVGSNSPCFVSISVGETKQPAAEGFELFVGLRVAHAAAKPAVLRLGETLLNSARSRLKPTVSALAMLLAMTSCRYELVRTPVADKYRP